MKYQRSKRLHLLTPRELQVMKLTGQGMTEAAIGKRFDRSTKTISTHRHTARKKLRLTVAGYHRQAFFLAADELRKSER